MKLSLSEHIKRSREAVAANKAKGNKHAELFASMYAQPSRFIEEILQNTEDAYSRKNSEEANTCVRFKLYADKVEIHHNGKDFDEDDLMSITTFANTTKKNNSEVNLIGKFGIGFKSVFSITDFPEIHCGKYHFKIVDYEVLSPCEPQQAEVGFTTLIILPFKRKNMEECLAAVKQGLTDLNDFHLLFLKKLNKIEVFDNKNLLKTIEKKTVRLIKNIEKHEIVYRTYLPLASEKSEKYLVYFKEGRYRSKMPELAFKVLEERGNFIFQPILDAPLFVYFPLQMHSGLNFLIHAPFTTNPLRDFALFNSENCLENIQLLNESVEYYAMALESFKKVRLYSIDLLGKLFIELPEIESTDQQKSIIQQKYYNAFLNFLTIGDNIPLGNKRFTKIQKVIIPEDESIYKLLSEKDLDKLFQKRDFVDAEICSENLTPFRNFLTNVLKVKTVDAESFGFRIKVTSGFLHGKSIKWLIEFYRYLHSKQKLWDIQHASLYYSVRTAPIILTESNSFVSAFDDEQNASVFLPGRKKELLTVVHHKLLGDESCMAFFDDLGIKLPEALDDVMHNIIPQFEQRFPINSADYYKKLEKVLTVYSESSLNKKKNLLDVLTKTAWVYSEDIVGNKSLSKPCEVYFKSELLFEYFRTSSSIRFLYTNTYLKLTRNYPDLAQTFFCEIGVANNPRVQHLDDAIPVIDGFDNFLDNIDFGSSRAFAMILISADENYLQEQLVQFLRKQKWVYTRKGVFAAPETMDITDVSTKYKFSEPQKTRLQKLMGLVSGRLSENIILPWYPKLKPSEVDVSSLMNKILNKAHIEGDPSLLSSLQTSLNLFDSAHSTLKEYSDTDLDIIHKWSGDFLLRFLINEFPEPDYKVLPTPLADFVIYKNEIVDSYVFFSGKTDLMNRYYFSPEQFINLCKLMDRKNSTFLYCINSVGTFAVSVRQFQNPFEMFIKGSIHCSGKLFLDPK